MLMNPRALSRFSSLLRRGARFVSLGILLGSMGSADLFAQQPTGGALVGGSGSIATAPGTTTITAGRDSIFRWDSFNIGAGEKVAFVQPGSDARVLNWIGGLTPSQIDGALTANGQVYLMNPAGIHFGGA